MTFLPEHHVVARSGAMLTNADPRAETSLISVSVSFFCFFFYFISTSSSRTARRVFAISNKNHSRYRSSNPFEITSLFRSSRGHDAKTKSRLSELRSHSPINVRPTMRVYTFYGITTVVLPMRLEIAIFIITPSATSTLLMSSLTFLVVRLAACVFEECRSFSFLTRLVAIARERSYTRSHSREWRTAFATAKLRMRVYDKLIWEESRLPPAVLKTTWAPLAHVDGGALASCGLSFIRLRTRMLRSERESGFAGAPKRRAIASERFEEFSAPTEIFRREWFE